MKKFSRIASVALATVCMSSMFAGCGGNKIEHDENTLYVAAINKGYGIEWLYGLLDEFSAAKGIKYEVTPVYDDSQITTRIESGAEYCNYDLVFTANKKPAADRFLADLTDVYASTYESGSRAGQTIQDSMDDRVWNFVEGSGKNVIPWTGGVNGLMVNYQAVAKVLGDGWENTYKVRTTDELIDFCEVLSEKGLAPFLHAAATQYYQFLYDCWFAQYNGIQGVNDYFEGKYVDEFGATRIGPEVCFNQGVLESAKVMEEIFSNGYSHKDSNGLEWDVCQTYFMLGNSAMFCNGDWNNQEMSKQFPNTDIRMIQTPVISALGDKLGITEEQLVQLIDYVDATNAGESATKPSIDNVDDLIAAVKEARSWAFTYADYHMGSVISYSTKIDLAKEFLKYMASDAGQAKFVEKTKGLTMCYGYDLESYAKYNELPAFAKSRWTIARDATLYFIDSTSTFGGVGLQPFHMRTVAPLEVLLSRTTNRKTAQDIYEEDYEYYKTVWSSFVLAGNQ